MKIFKQKYKLSLKTKIYIKEVYEIYWPQKPESQSTALNNIENNCPPKNYAIQLKLSETL